MLAFSPPSGAEAQIEIVAVRLAPFPPSYDTVNWVLVDYHKGAIREIELTTKWQSKFSGLQESTQRVPVPDALKDKAAGTLILPHQWRERNDAEELRTLVVQLRDASGKMAVTGRAFTLGRGWTAASPLRLTGAASEAAAAGSAGDGIVRVRFEAAAPARPRTLYVEAQPHSGPRQLHEIPLDASRLAGDEILWPWQRAHGGPWTLRVWIVDELGNQSNALQLRLPS
jgi:hypothetical protein